MHGDDRRVRLGRGLRAATVVGALALGACAKSEAPMERARPEVRPAQVRDAVVRIEHDAQAIRNFDDPNHRALVNALRFTADALAGFDPGPEARAHARDVRLYADRLANLGAASGRHAEWAQAALTSAVESLETMASARNLTEARPWIRQARAAAQAIHPTVPLLDQEQAVGNALDALSNALVYTLGAASEKQPAS